MNLTQAYEILEIQENLSMNEIKQIYRGLVQIWHPDRYMQNERLQNKALKKMKELNEAYDYICFHFNIEKATDFTHSESKQKDSTKTIIVCPECGTKNRVPSSIRCANAKCARCGNHLLRKKQEGQIDTYWEQSTPRGAW